jgi:hypothetical protein
MTESEWLVCTEPQRMLGFLFGNGSGRKFRLFAVACCRRLWELLDENGRRAVEAAEGFADGLTDASELRDAAIRAHRRVDDFHVGVNLGGHGVVLTRDLAASEAVFIACSTLCGSIGSGWVAQLAVSALGNPAESVIQCHLLRDIIGSPFRLSPPVSTTVLAWNDGGIMKLARAIDDERAFDRLPILADALEDAGCGNAEILAHCRQPGEHVRGCLVIDLLLGKE